MKLLVGTISTGNSKESLDKITELVQSCNVDHLVVFNGGNSHETKAIKLEFGNIGVVNSRYEIYKYAKDNGYTHILFTDDDDIIYSRSIESLKALNVTTRLCYENFEILKYPKVIDESNFRIYRYPSIITTCLFKIEDLQALELYKVEDSICILDDLYFNLIFSKRPPKVIENSDIIIGKYVTSTTPRSIISDYNLIKELDVINKLVDCNNEYEKAIYYYNLSFLMYNQRQLTKSKFPKFFL